MGMDRRGFILASAGAVAALTAPACASVAMTRVTPTDGTVRLTIRSYPQLAGPGGYLRLAPEGAATPVYLLVLATGGYAAVSPICTHLGCTVGIEGSRLVCPCHGSTYDREGKVLRGPAERPLLRYPLRVSEQGDLVISLEGAP